MPLSLTSIVIPCYNAEEFIEETIKSCLAQTYSELEIVVVDDGSTDNSVEVLKSFGDRIRWDATSNRGGCAARNRGLELASGDFIQFLDADDLLSSNKIEKQVMQLEGAPPGTISISNVVYFNHGDAPERGQQCIGYPDLNSDDPVKWLIDLWTPGDGYGETRWGMVPVHAYLTPRSVIDRVGPWNEALSIDQDGEFFARIVTSCSGIRWQPDSFAYYRKFPDRRSVSRGSSNRNFRDRICSIDVKRISLDNALGSKWGPAAYRSIARQYMDVAVWATPRYPKTAWTAFQKARSMGGYPANEFVGYSQKSQIISRFLPWPVVRLVQEGVAFLRRLMTWQEKDAS